MALLTKRIYDPPAPGDGFRLLIMRLWPRGIRRDRIDEWQKELGPSPELLRGFLDGKVDWPEYTRRYRSEMRGKPELLEHWARRARAEDITLLCGCKDASRCHRTLLKELLESWPG
jgi:uncharacterized protein YeaO (DUF488 family)